jgi:hypothetical protein
MTFSPWRLPLACFVLVFASASVLQVPASVLPSMLGRAGAFVSANGSAGTIWNGALQGAQIMNVPVGEVRFHFSSFGRRFEWSSAASHIQSKGEVKISMGGWQDVSNLEVVTVLDRLSPELPLSGRVQITAKSGYFRGQSCQDIEGSATLTGTLNLVERFPISLTGPLACDRGQMSAVINGTLGAYPATLGVRFNDLTEADFTFGVSGVPESAGRALVAVGFRGEGRNYELGQTLQLH